MRAGNSGHLACPQQWKDPTMVNCITTNIVHHKIGLATIATVTVNSSMEHVAVVLRPVPIPLGHTTSFLFVTG